MLKRVFFVRPLIVSVFFLLFVDLMAMQEEDATVEQKQEFLQENIEQDYRDAFVQFLNNKKEGGDDIIKWTMEELKQVVKEFQGEKPLQANEEINGNDDPVEVNNMQTNKKDELEIEKENNNVATEIIGQNNEQNLLTNEEQGGDKSTLQDSFFIFYRYGGKFLASLVLSVVNSYCGFEQLVMNDWYCFKYAMCSGYRLQPRFMRSRVWIDMNFNFLEGIAGVLIRFFLFNPSYNMYENIFDFFNVCIDIKVYNNLYFAVNIVGFVRSIVLLSIFANKFINPFLQHELGV